MTSPFMQMSWLGSFNLRGAKVTGSEQQVYYKQGKKLQNDG